MKTLSLEFEMNDLKLQEPDLKLGSAEFMKRVIASAVMQYSDQHNGIGKLERNQAYWLRETLERAVKDDMKEVEIADDVFGFLRKVFRDTRLIPDKILERVERNIDAVKTA